MLCLDECKAKLVSFKQCFGHEFGIKSIGIFGSVAKAALKGISACMS